MNLEELEARVKTLEDIEEVKKLQRSYGYYLEHGMVEEIIDLFADDPDGGFWHAGTGMYRGKEGVRNFFGGYCRSSQSTEFIAQLIQLSGIVDVDPNGKTAKGTCQNRRSALFTWNASCRIGMPAPCRPAGCLRICPMRCRR